MTKPLDYADLTQDNAFVPAPGKVFLTNVRGQTETAGGIALPEYSTLNCVLGTVWRLGDKKEGEGFVQLQEGDDVLLWDIAKKNVTKVELSDGFEFCVLNYHDILGMVG